MEKFHIPEIPDEFVVKVKDKINKVWALEDLELNDPTIFINWDVEKESFMDQCSHPNLRLVEEYSKAMIEDPELDISLQLEKVERQVRAGSSFYIFSPGALAFSVSKLITFKSSQLGNIAY